MRLLYGKEQENARYFMLEAAKIAEKSLCMRSKCGSVIVKENNIIGRGFNSPPKNKKDIERCLKPSSSYNEKVTDKTCCIHAEERAIIDALRNNANELIDSALYFIRLGKEGEITFAKNPYCTICSKLSLDVGIKDFVLWHEHGIVAYNTEEYNNLSFNYK
ncbi:MAG: hypothetical protein ACP5OG_02895 [Candidatus Nanoarchaeia archaeon]